MTANHQHTPTTQEVQWAAITTTFEDSFITEDAFNRWLDARDARITAAAEQRGAVKALREAAIEISVRDGSTARGIIWSDRDSIVSWLRKRADRIADKEGGE